MGVGLPQLQNSDLSGGEQRPSASSAHPPHRSAWRRLAAVGTWRQLNECHLVYAKLNEFCRVFYISSLYVIHDIISSSDN